MRKSLLIPNVMMGLSGELRAWKQASVVLGRATGKGLATAPRRRPILQ